MSIIIIAAELDRESDRLPESIGIQYGWGVTAKWGIERSTILTLDDFVVHGIDRLELAKRLRRDYGQESVLLLETAVHGYGTHRMSLIPAKGADCTLLDGGYRFAVYSDDEEGDLNAFLVTADGCESPV